MAVAGILRTTLLAAASPKNRPEVKTAGLEHLDKKTALILYAVAEAVLGENFLQKAPKFVETVDDYLNYQRPAQRAREGKQQPQPQPGQDNQEILHRARIPSPINVGTGRLSKSPSR